MRVLPLLTVVCLSAGCRMDNSWHEGVYQAVSESGSDGTIVKTEGFREHVSSVLDGDWYVFGRVKKEGDDIQKITFASGILNDMPTKQEKKKLAGYYRILQFEGYWEVPYAYDEENLILTLDYSKRFQIWESILQKMQGKQTKCVDLEQFLQEHRVEEAQAELSSIEKEFPGGMIEYYAPRYDDIMFVYRMYPDKQAANKHMEYDNAHFPNSVIYLEKNGNYCALEGVYARKAEFPNAKSMPLGLGCETVEACLCRYYAGWAGVLSRGCLEAAYGIREESLDLVSEKTGREYHPELVGRDNLCLENIEDVPRDDKVFKMYKGCPLEEVKYVTYSYDGDGGRQTGGIYTGRTYGLWSVIWVER